MTKTVVREARFDFRGGRNSAVSPDLLNPNELVDATNARLVTSYGAITKRNGTQRIHPTAFPGVIRGVCQWDAPNGKEVVVLANGHLFYRLGWTYATAWTDEGTAPFSTTDPAYFMPFRAATSGAPLVLYIASAGKLFSWTGSSGAPILTDITATTTAADRIIAYHTRGFAHNKNYKKHIFWSKIGDATAFATGTKTDGGSAMVDVLNGEELVALEVIGSSLLLAAEDSISRFTGISSDDIVIEQDTEGISSEIGAVGGLALKRFESVAAVLSDRGPYGVTESGVEPIGEQVAPDFDALDKTRLSNSIVQYHRGRKELLFIVPGASDSGLKTIYTHAVRLQAWQGPWVYSHKISASCRYEDVVGSENWLSGSEDGFVRLMDVGFLDDVLSTGSGGSNITMRVELPPLHFGDLGITKAAKQMMLEAKLPSNHALDIALSFDEGSPNSGSFVDTTYDSALRHYRVDLDGQGKRGKLVFTDASAVAPTIHGFVALAYDMGRP